MGKMVIKGNFEWDEDKNKANISKHGISFEEILPMFDDPLFWEQYDESHSDEDETRYLGMARIEGVAVLVSSYVDCGRIRIISARVSTREEQRRYEKWCEQFYS